MRINAAEADIRGQNLLLVVTCRPVQVLQPVQRKLESIKSILGCHRLLLTPFQPGTRFVSRQVPFAPAEGRWSSCGNTSALIRDFCIQVIPCAFSRATTPRHHALAAASHSLDMYFAAIVEDARTLSRHYCPRFTCASIALIHISRRQAAFNASTFTAEVECTRAL